MKWHKLTFKTFITLQRGFDLPVTEMKDGEVPVFPLGKGDGHERTVSRRVRRGITDRIFHIRTGEDRVPVVGGDLVCIPAGIRVAEHHAVLCKVDVIGRVCGVHVLRDEHGIGTREHIGILVQLGHLVDDRTTAAGPELDIRIRVCLFKSLF